jgi:muramidase (phage lysozyme)
MPAPSSSTGRDQTLANVTEHRTSPSYRTDQTFANVSEHRTFPADRELDNAFLLLTFTARDYAQNISEGEIHLAAYEITTTWASPSGSSSDSRALKVHTQSLAKLSALVDMMMFDKQGVSKNPDDIFNFMRGCAAIREIVLHDLATEHGIDLATEHVNGTTDLSEASVAECYKKLAWGFLQNDLLPHQKKDKRYQIHANADGEWKLTNHQRSFIDNIIRNNLGHTKNRIPHLAVRIALHP